MFLLFKLANDKLHLKKMFKMYFLKLSFKIIMILLLTHFPCVSPNLCVSASSLFLSLLDSSSFLLKNVSKIICGKFIGNRQAFLT